MLRQQEAALSSRNSMKRFLRKRLKLSKTLSTDRVLGREPPWL